MLSVDRTRPKRWSGNLRAENRKMNLVEIQYNCLCCGYEMLQNVIYRANDDIEDTLELYTNHEKPQSRVVFRQSKFYKVENE